MLAVMAALCLPAAASAQSPAPDEVADTGAYLAARSAIGEHDYDDAAYWFSRALVRDADNPVLLEGLVLSQIGTGNFEAAAATAERMSTLGGRSIAANIALLVRDAGAEAYEALLSAPESRAIGNLNDKLVRAWSEFGAGRMSDAVTLFDEIAATEGLKPFGLYHKALALAAVGDFEAADAILSGQADGPLVVNRRGVIAHVQILSQLERFDDALALLDRSFGPRPEPLVDAMRADLRARKPLTYDVALTAREGIAEVMFTLASALNGEAEPGYTLLYARSAIALNPAHVEAVLVAADLLQALGQLDLAAEAYALIPEDHPAYYHAELGRVGLLFALERKDEGFAALEALTSRFPDVSVIQLKLGDYLRREERFAEAAEAYGKAIATLDPPEPRNWGLFYARAISYERAGMWDKAEPDFRRALELSPDQPEVLNYLGYSFVDKGENLDEALKLIERAVAIEPEQGYIIDSLAWAYFRLGRYQDALAPMEKASLLEPVDPIVTDHLGDVYWAVGRKLEAQFQWRRALSFDPVEKDAIRIRRKLEIGLDAVLAEEGAPPLIGVSNGN